MRPLSSRQQPLEAFLKEEIQKVDAFLKNRDELQKVAAIQLECLRFQETSFEQQANLIDSLATARDLMPILEHQREAIRFVDQRIQLNAEHAEISGIQQRLNVQRKQNPQHPKVEELDRKIKACFASITEVRRIHSSERSEINSKIERIFTELSQYIEREEAALAAEREYEANSPEALSERLRGVRDASSLFRDSRREVTLSLKIERCEQILSQMRKGKKNSGIDHIREFNQLILECNQILRAPGEGHSARAPVVPVRPDPPPPVRRGAPLPPARRGAVPAPARGGAAPAPAIRAAAPAPQPNEEGLLQTILSVALKVVLIALPIIAAVVGMALGAAVAAVGALAIFFPITSPAGLALTISGLALLFFSTGALVAAIAMPIHTQFQERAN